MSISPDNPDTLTIWDRAKGVSPGTALAQGITSWIMAAFLAGISGFQKVAEFLFLPFVIFVEVGVRAVEQLILVPLGITNIGLQITGSRLDIFGILALPISVAIALLVLLMITVYLMFSVSSNAIPGIIVDNRVWAFLFTTPEEEEQGED